MHWRSFVAMGDSFTEGMYDPYPDGTYRGWADLVAARLAVDAGPGFGYANLAVRGRLIDQVVDEQLEPTLAMKPDLVSFAAGGKYAPPIFIDSIDGTPAHRAGIQAGDRIVKIDGLATKDMQLSDAAGLVATIDRAVGRMRAAGADVILFRFADIAAQLPGQRIVGPRAAAINEGARDLAEKHGTYLIDLFVDDTFRNPAMWAADRLHLSPAGHRRVAGHVLNTLGVGVDEEWLLVPPLPAPTPWLLARSADLRWARQHLAPWIRRRLVGTSSGDLVRAKRPQLSHIDQIA